ncbi:hypothetical protein JXA63_00410 [Candidatus Woesebacteria bacterium]|nr:hypothetical protein [Candidatus Woesebacteria bacterium]
MNNENRNKVLEFKGGEIQDLRQTGEYWTVLRSVIVFEDGSKRSCVLDKWGPSMGPDDESIKNVAEEEVKARNKAGQNVTGFAVETYTEEAAQEEGLIDVEWIRHKNHI